MLGFLIFIFLLVFLLLIIFGFGLQRVFIKKGNEIIKIKRVKPITWILGFLGIIFLILLLSSIRVVPVGHALVVFWILPKRFSVYPAGVNIIPPIITHSVLYDLRRQEYTMSGAPGEGRRKGVDDALWSPTKEGLKVGLDLTCWYRLDPKRVFEIHKKIGPNYEEKVIRPAIRSIARLTVSGYGIMDIYSNRREEIQNEINKRIKEILEPDGFIVDGVVLRDVRFTEDFAKAIEEKQIAQQEAERMEYVLEKERKEAERRAIEAEGKAKAISIVSRELKKNPQYIKYLYVDKIADDIKVIISDQPTIMDLKGFMSK